MAVGAPVYTLVPEWTYNFLGLHHIYESSKYSVVTQIPGVTFSSENPHYLLRCSTFSKIIEHPLEAFHNEELRHSLYDFNTQGASIEDLNDKNINNANDIMRFTTSIDMHKNIVFNTSRNTTFSNVIDSANAISIAAKDIVYNISASLLHNMDSLYTIHVTIARGNSYINETVMDILYNYKHDNGNSRINIYHSLDIIPIANEIITEATNDINLANEAHKKLQAESFSDWSRWGIVVSVMCSATLLITGITLNIDISSLM